MLPGTTGKRRQCQQVIVVTAYCCCCVPAYSQNVQINENYFGFQSCFFGTKQIFSVQEATALSNISASKNGRKFITRNLCDKYLN